MKTTLVMRVLYQQFRFSQPSHHYITKDITDTKLERNTFDRHFSLVTFVSLMFKDEHRNKLLIAF